MRTLVILFLLSIPGAYAASNVRFKKIDPANSQLVMKNYGDATVDMSSWYFSSSGANLGFTSPSVVIESGSVTLAPGAEISILFNHLHYLAGGPDALSLFNGGSIIDPGAMVDFVAWQNLIDPRAATAVAKGIWTASTALPVGDLLTYTGNGSDTGARESLWSSRQVNVRLLSVEPADNRLTLKNFDTMEVDVENWILRIGGANASLTHSNVHVVSGSANLMPGDELTIRFDVADFISPTGSTIGIFRNGGFSNPGSLVDFVQWILPNGFVENIAIAKGIWTNEAVLPADTSYHYYGDGTDTGLRQIYWEEDFTPPAAPIEASFTFNAAGQPHLEFTTVVGRDYQVFRTTDLADWQPASVKINATGALATWTDATSLSARGFYKIVDVTP